MKGVRHLAYTRIESASYRGGALAVLMRGKVRTDALWRV